MYICSKILCIKFTFDLQEIILCQLRQFGTVLLILVSHKKPQFFDLETERIFISEINQRLKR